MFTLSPEQEEVMEAIVKWYAIPVKDSQVFYLAGYAGTGKSTILEHAITAIKDKYGAKKIITAAYTGKAASVLQKKGVPGAMTIHKMMYMPYKDQNKDLQFAKREDCEAMFADLIVLDECSMIGGEIADDIRALRKKILILGDPGQLPPIRRRNEVPRDGSFTDLRPDRFLKEIHRQAADSPILELATLARQGKPLPMGYKKGNVRVLPLDWNSYKEYLFDPTAQPICGINANRWTYTQEIRKSRGLYDRNPQAGEKIMCCKTNYRWGFYNGYMGELIGMNIIPEEISDKNGKMHKIDSWRLDVKLEDMEITKYKVLTDPYLFQNHFCNGKIDPLPFNEDNYGVYSEFDWGYVITCHKAQGSQYDNVVVIDDSHYFKEERSRWMYTALTRAVDKLTVLTRG